MKIDVHHSCCCLLPADPRTWPQLHARTARALPLLVAYKKPPSLFPQLHAFPASVRAVL